MNRVSVAAIAAALLFTVPGVADAQRRNPHPAGGNYQAPPPREPRTPAPPPEAATPATPITPADQSAQTAPATPPAQTAQAAPPAQPGVYTDAQLTSFVAASGEIEPLTQSLSTATPEARTAAIAQIRASLQSHGLDGATYNAIATSMQTDTALAARVNGLRTAPPTATASTTAPNAAGATSTATPPAATAQATPPASATASTATTPPRTASMSTPMVTPPPG